jgi:hypothetical protein
VYESLKIKAVIPNTAGTTTNKTIKSILGKLLELATIKRSRCMVKLKLFIIVPIKLPSIVYYKANKKYF